MLEFTVGARPGGSAPPDLVSAAGAELGIIPYARAAAWAVGVLVLAAETLQIFRAWTVVMHESSIPYTDRD